MGITPDRRRSAKYGVALALLGIISLGIGTFLLPGSSGSDLFDSVVFVAFGVLLAVSSILVFVLPAAYDYIDETIKGSLHHSFSP